VDVGDSEDRSRLLVEPSLLAKGDLPEPPVVLDARAKQKYKESRVPQARWVDAAAWAKAFGDGKDAAAWGRRIGDLGISTDSTVIVYDDAKSKDAARVWWILRYWGLRDVRLLDGGWFAYTAAKLPIETGAPRPPAPISFAAVPGTERLATKESVLAVLQTGGIQIIDARSEKEYCGVEK
jgi:thiosulfate/3-mercaptopyruvate sulfurtransferase